MGLLRPKLVEGFFCGRRKWSTYHVSESLTDCLSGLLEELTRYCKMFVQYMQSVQRCLCPALQYAIRRSYEILQDVCKKNVQYMQSVQVKGRCLCPALHCNRHYEDLTRYCKMFVNKSKLF